MITQGEIIAILGLSNGMLGGTILVLPLFGIKTGWAIIPLVAIFFGLLSMYSCYLIVYHLGKCSNIRQSILEHFNNKHSATVVYNAIIGFSFVGGIINYYTLIILQIQGFIPPSKFIAVCVAIILFFLTILMRLLKFGQKFLALGIVSIFAYLIFLTWGQATSPSGSNVVPAVGYNYIDLSASLIMGYSIHDFVTQILLKTTTQDKYVRAVIITYIIGMLAYLFITYGAFAIINRKPSISNPQTIQQYFQRSSWQRKSIQILYMVHMFSVTPQFLIIMRLRILQIFKLEESPKITIPELSVYFLMYAICLISNLANIKLSTIIVINGAVIGSIYIFAIPIFIHVKCVYFSIHDEKGYMISEDYRQNGQIIEYYGECECKLEYRNKYTKNCELIFLIFILLVGAATMIHTLQKLFFSPEHTKQIVIVNHTSDL